jgi:transketolase C-terminal domain/subunit
MIITTFSLFLTSNPIFIKTEDVCFRQHKVRLVVASSGVSKTIYHRPQVSYSFLAVQR